MLPVNFQDILYIFLYTTTILKSVGIHNHAAELLLLFLHISRKRLHGR